MKLKSKLELAFHTRFPSHEYEAKAFKYIVPASDHKYTPDWRINETLYVETKGYLDKRARDVALYMKEQHPEVEVVFVFESGKKRIHSNSKTTYMDWCNKNGIRFLDWKQIKENPTKTIEELLNENYPSHPNPAG